MMVVAAGSEKQCAGIPPDHLVEPKAHMIERLGLGNVRNVQVNVSDLRPGRHSAPWNVTGSFDKARDVERIDGHRELSSLVLPGAPVAVSIHLDAEPVG